MSEPKQITDLDELEGKTVKLAFSGCALIHLVFEDGTFLRIHSENGWDDEANLDWKEPPESDFEFVEMEFMTIDEYESRKAQQKRDREQREAEADRREYERLRAKFEGPPRA